MAGPLHPFSVGMMVIVELSGLVPVFTAVKLGTFPVPLAANPIEVLELVHVKLAPVGMLAGFCEDTTVSAQTMIFSMVFTFG